MATVSFSDLAQTMLLKASQARLLAQSVKNTEELTSGKISDVGKKLSGDQIGLSAIMRALDMNQAYNSSAQKAANTTQATQNILDKLRSLGSDLSNQLTSSLHDRSDSSLSLIAARGQQSFEDAISSINISQGGESILSGTSTTGAALAQPNVIMTAIRRAVTGSTTAEQIMDRLNNWLDSPTGYDAVAYIGGPPKESIAISEADEADISLTAKGDEFKKILMSFAATSLINDNSVNLSRAEKLKLKERSLEQASTGISAITYTSAAVGVTQGYIETILSENQAQAYSLTLQASEIADSDPYELATELKALETTMEVLYAVTSRLSRLNLSDYLR